MYDVSTQFYTLLLHNCIHYWYTIMYIVGALLCGFYTATKLLLIHRITNFYVMSVSKMFKRILIIGSMNLIVHHVLFFKFQIFEKTRSSSCVYACSLHVLCIVPMLIIHTHILKHDVGGGNHGCLRWNVRIYMQHGTKNLYAHLDH